ncbi:MAG: arsenate reductase ArsC [Phycisphaerales bacterium]|jgi:arsenate reductase
MTGPAPHNAPLLTFLCTGNSCRSQMAEAWARELFGDVLQIASAGTLPHGINPLAAQVMDEAGVSIRHHASKHIDSLPPAALLITVCDHAHETCPVAPCARRMHAPFRDPPRMAASCDTQSEVLNAYRIVRDEIRAFVTRLPESAPELFRGGSR